MAIRVHLHRFSSSALMLCLLLALYLVTVDSLPHEKPFQSDQSDLIDTVPKFPPSYSANSDLEIGGGSNDIAESVEDRAKILSKIMSLVLEGKKLPPHLINKFPRALLSGQHKRQIRYQQCYFNPISCF